MYCPVSSNPLFKNSSNLPKTLFLVVFPLGGEKRCTLGIGYSDCSYNLRLTIKNSTSILSISNPYCFEKNSL